MKKIKADPMLFTSYVLLGVLLMVFAYLLPVLTAVNVLSIQNILILASVAGIIASVQYISSRTCCTESL